ncbi:patatin-like phospholipase family protein [Aeromicrobium sp.]|uniref:patatin-like phospholipase family protein n=1 Tax=Aeromicrobium sp. TaxID=1871063 RepID=UPI002FCA031A
MNTSTKRALVLGGGGSTGNAWLIGIVAGLYDGGLDVTSPDLTIGTSAGSTAAAQFAGAAPPDLYEMTIAPVPQRSGPGRPMTDHLERLKGVIASSENVDDWRRKMCKVALEIDAASDGSWSAQWRETVAARLPNAQWPERTIRITAVDAHTAEPIEFDRDSGVELVDAVAASCAGGPPYRIGDDLYIDGGYRTNAENADLAAGYERVLVLSPLGGQTLHPPEWGTGLSAQVDGLRAGGSRVVTVIPNSSDEHLFGANAMDFSLRPAAAQAGYEQATVIVERLSEFWR